MAREITNRDSLLQIGAKGVTNRGRYYKLGQILQIGAEHPQTYFNMSLTLKVAFFTFLNSYFPTQFLAIDST